MKLLNRDLVLWQVLFNVVVRGDVYNVILREGQVLRGLTDCISFLEQPHGIQWILPFCICWGRQVWWHHLFHFLRNQFVSAQKSTRYHLDPFWNFPNFLPFWVFTGFPCTGLSHFFLLPFFILLIFQEGAMPYSWLCGQKGPRFVVPPYLCLTAAWKHKGFC